MRNTAFWYYFVYNLALYIMKTLYFSRHAKSDWGDFRLADIDRPLNSRGKKDAPYIAEKLHEKVGHIDLCVTSSAKRARATAKRYKKVFSFEATLKEPKIYEATVADLMEVVNELPDQYNSAILFGHNPGYTYLFNYFADHALDNLPTAGVFSVHSVAKSWAELDKANSEIGFLIYPKMYSI